MRPSERWQIATDRVIELEAELVTARKEKRESSKALLAEMHVMPKGHFTDTEKKVTDCLLRHMRNKEIMVELGIGLSTVKFHVRNILRKTGAINRHYVADYEEKQ